MITQELCAGEKNALLIPQSVEDLIEWPQLDRLTVDQEFEAALDYLRNDRTGSAHLTPVLTDRLVQEKIDACLADTVGAHLQTCEWCASMLREALQFCVVPADHSAFTLLEQAKQNLTEDSEASTEWIVIEVIKDEARTETADVALAFEGWVEQVTDGMATLRLVDQEGQRSTATYAVTDLERDHIPAEIGTAFRCQIIRESTGFRVSFQPVPRRVVSKERRKKLEDKMMAAYSNLQNDY